MKKTAIYLMMLLMAMTFALNSKASTKVGTPVCWTVPTVFTPDQEVTFYYDVTDVGFPEGVDLYLWAWQPSEPDAGNGDNSSEFAGQASGSNLRPNVMTCGRPSLLRQTADKSGKLLVKMPIRVCLSIRVRR